MRLAMSCFNISVKCLKLHTDRLATCFFETHTTLHSALSLYDVYTLTREHFIDLLSLSKSGYTFELKVECNGDYLIGKTKIPSSK